MTVAPFFRKIADVYRPFKFKGADSVAADSASAGKGGVLLESVADERASNQGAELVSADAAGSKRISKTRSFF